MRYEILQRAVTPTVFTLIGIGTIEARKTGNLSGAIYRDAGKYGGPI